MRIVQAEELQEIDIAKSEIILEGGKLNILPSVKNYFKIDYKPKRDTLSLVAGGFIGLIPINDELAIEVKPKFSISNLTRIVSIAEDKFKTLDFFSRKYHEHENASPVVFEFMAECLVIELQSLETDGLLKSYLLKKEDSHVIRGRVNVDDSIRSLWSHGHFNKVVVNYFDFSPDNHFNRLIKYTLLFCIKDLSARNSPRKTLRQSLIEFYSMFEAVSYDHKLICLDEVQSDIKGEKVTALRHYYTNICEICRLIVSKTGVSFDEEGGEVELKSYILDMASIFEKYVLNSLRLHRRFFSKDTMIRDGNKEGRKKFFNQPSSHQGPAKPDIILIEGNSCRVIADAKYKTKSKESDRYQVISHALSYNSKNAVLILPRKINQVGNPLVKLGSVGVEFEIDVYEYYFDLSSNDLPKEERALSENLASLCTGAPPACGGFR